MDKALNCYNQARVAYNEILDLIEKYSFAVKSFAFPEFESGVAMREFDNILQSILFQIAISDKEFHPLEAKFIAKITQKGGLIDIINNRFQKNYTWDSLKEEDVETVISYAKLSEKLVEDEADDFIAHFSILIDIIGVDFLQEINTKLLTIIKSISSIDGHADPEEEEAFNNAYGNLILQKWEARKNQKDEFCAKNNPKKMPSTHINEELKKNSVLKKSSKQK